MNGPCPLRRSFALGALALGPLVLGALVLGALVLGGTQAAHAQALPGWPAQLGNTAAGFSPPTAGDIDGDGDLELLATVGDPLSQTSVREGIYAFHHDGVEVVDGDQDANTVGVLAAIDFSATFLRSPVTLGDLDDDPALEILCFGPHELYAFNGDGTPVPGWPVHFPGSQVDSFNQAPIMVADVDADGSNEVIFTSGAVPGVPDASALHVLTAAGTPLSPGWPVTLDRWTFGATVYAGVVADFVDVPGKHGHLEILVGPHPTANAAHGITAFDSGGQQLWQHPIAAADFVAADMDGDGRLEVVAVEVPRVERQTFVTSVVMLDGQGEVEHRYRIELGPRVHVLRVQGQDFFEHQSFGYVGAHPVNELQPDMLLIGRVDGDSTPDVVVSTRFYEHAQQYIGGVEQTTVLAHRGRIHAIDLVHEVALPSFPLHFDYDLPASPPVISPERLIDLDGDGRVEILASELPDTFEKRLSFWDADGDDVLGASLVATTPGSFILEPVLRRGTFGDFDADGRLDFASAIRRGELHVTRIPSSPFPPMQLPGNGWPEHRFDAQRTGVWRP